MEEVVVEANRAGGDRDVPRSLYVESQSRWQDKSGLEHLRTSGAPNASNYYQDERGGYQERNAGRDEWGYRREDDHKQKEDSYDWRAALGREEDKKTSDKPGKDSSLFFGDSMIVNKTKTRKIPGMIMVVDLNFNDRSQKENTRFGERDHPERKEDDIDNFIDLLNNKKPKGENIPRDTHDSFKFSTNQGFYGEFDDHHQQRNKGPDQMLGYKENIGGPANYQRGLGEYEGLYKDRPSVGEIDRHQRPSTGAGVERNTANSYRERQNNYPEQNYYEGSARGQGESMRLSERERMGYNDENRPDMEFTKSSFKTSFLDGLRSVVNETDKKSVVRSESPENVKKSILMKNEALSKTLENCQDPNFLTKSALKGRTDDAIVVPDTVNIGRDKPKLGRYSDYEMLMPPDYYTFLAKKNVEMDKDPWYIRSHHIETLTGKAFASI